MRTDALLFTSDLRSALVGIPISLLPPAVWLDLESGTHPVPAWPLTPPHHARVKLSCLALEDRWAQGDYPLEKIQVVWQRWQVLDDWASSCWSEQELLAAYSHGLREGFSTPLPQPPPLVSDPFTRPKSVHMPGVSGAAVRRERQRQRQVSGTTSRIKLPPPAA